MRYKQNLHTHTTYCDGKDSVEELIKKAISLGFDSLGFSGHVYRDTVDYDGLTYGGSLEAYKQEIAQMQEKYKGEIKVYCGIEYDILSNMPQEGFDYLIGSLHYLSKDGRLIAMDYRAPTVKEIIKKEFLEDGMAYAKAYYQTLARLPEYGKFDIVGHFDLVAKHCEKENFFDIESREYQNAALEGLHAVAKECKVFEVNTGAVARGYRTTPYPAPFLLKELKTLGCGVVISSDCHNKDLLDYGFDQALQYVKSCGFDEVLTFDGKGFIGNKI